MNFKDFILSLVSPLKMQRYRTMSILIAMLIFVLSVYMLVLPNSFYLKRNKEKLLNDDSYWNICANLPDTEIDELKFRIDAAANAKELVATDASEDLYKQKFALENIVLKKKNHEKLNLYLVFDANDTASGRLDEITNKINDLKLKYAEVTYKAVGKDAFSKLKKKQKMQAEIMAIECYKRDKNVTKDTADFKGIPDDLDYKKVTDDFKERLPFALFEIEDYDDNTYFIAFVKDGFYTQIPIEKGAGEVGYATSLKVLYQGMKKDFDFKRLRTLSDLGSEIEEGVKDILVSQAKNHDLLTIILYVLIYPALFCLLIKWTMGKKGVLRTFKSYYNVGSIASIVPIFIAFVLAWFTEQAIMIYGGLFSLMSLFVFIKINATSNLTD